MMIVNNAFEIGQIVFLKHDRDQLPRSVAALRLTIHEVMYELNQGSTTSAHYDFEISSSTDVLLTSTN